MATKIFVPYTAEGPFWEHQQKLLDNLKYALTVAYILLYPQLGLNQEGLGQGMTIMIDKRSMIAIMMIDDRFLMMAIIDHRTLGLFVSETCFKTCFINFHCPCLYIIVEFILMCVLLNAVC